MHGQPSRRYFVPRVTSPRVPVCGCACSKILQEYRSFRLCPPHDFPLPSRVVTYFFIRRPFIVSEWLGFRGLPRTSAGEFTIIYSYQWHFDFFITLQDSRLIANAVSDSLFIWFFILYIVFILIRDIFMNSFWIKILSGPNNLLFKIVSTLIIRVIEIFAYAKSESTVSLIETFILAVSSDSISTVTSNEIITTFYLF